ncbi:MAG TPA: hypothetical protein VFG60_00395 [Burkholderiaceae bacterium]|nr:hypothetical protein [Burkholderiaceae bacterium]
MKLALPIGAAALLLAALASTAAPAAKPEPGIYDGEFCVATSDVAPRCGPAQLELLSSGTAAVRVADLVYVMQMSGSDIAVVLMQQGMQLDEFTVPFEWVGRRLQFYDRARSTNYELRFPQASAEKR